MHRGENNCLAIEIKVTNCFVLDGALRKTFLCKALFPVKHCADVSYSNEMKWQVLVIFFSHFRGKGYNDKAYLNSSCNRAKLRDTLLIQFKLSATNMLNIDGRALHQLMKTLNWETINVKLKKNMLDLITWLKTYTVHSHSNLRGLEVADLGCSECSICIQNSSSGFDQRIISARQVHIGDVLAELVSLQHHTWNLVPLQWALNELEVLSLLWTHQQQASTPTTYGTV